MSLTFAALTDLLRRAKLSVQRGYTMALGDHYAALLGGTDGSASGLVALCKSALGATAEPIVPPEPVETPTLVPPAPAEVPVTQRSSTPVPPPPAPEPEPVAEIEPPADVEMAALVQEEMSDLEEDAAEAPPSVDAPAATKPPRRRKKK